jgi:hypothetical protein
MKLGKERPNLKLLSKSAEMIWKALPTMSSSRKLTE